MGEYYDREGKEITQKEWAVLHADFDYKVVVKEEIRGCQVSTVWLGIDHSFADNDPPVIFETMVFGGPFDQFDQRWRTEEEARRGHNTIVQMIIWYQIMPREHEWVRIS
jgi:hypothetical protein